MLLMMVHHFRRDCPIESQSLHQYLVKVKVSLRIDHHAIPSHHYRPTSAGSHKRSDQRVKTESALLSPPQGASPSQKVLHRSPWRLLSSVVYRAGNTTLISRHACFSRLHATAEGSGGVRSGSCHPSSGYRACRGLISGSLQRSNKRS